MQENSRILQFAPLSFDASISEIIMALCSGAKLYLFPPNLFPSSPSWMNQIKQANITHLTIQPSLLSILPHQDLPTLQ